MPSEGRRLHRFTVVSRGLRHARQLLLPAILGGASAGGEITEVLQWIALFLSVPSLAIATAQWLAFRFRIEGDDLVIDSGVLVRRRRVIPLARVQNVDLAQSTLERLARVAELRLETASGGSDTEATLAVLSLQEAQELQGELLRRRGPAQPALAVRGAPADEGSTGRAPERQTPDGAAEVGVSPLPASERRQLLRLGTADLVIAGATSNEAGLIAAGLATLLEVVNDLAGFGRLESAVEDVFARGATLGPGGAVAAVALLVAMFFLLGWVVSIGATVVRFHGFTLTRIGDDLERAYGLLSRHRSTIPLDRVQAVRIEETLLRRPLGLAALKIETAGAGPQRQDGRGGRAEAFVPLARRRDVGRLLAEVFEDADLEGVRFNGVAPVSRRRGFRRLALPIMGAAAILAAAVRREWLALLLLLAPAWLFARAQYRARAWGRTPGYALARGGVLTRTTWVVPERKIQTLHLVESPFQRRWELGTVVVDTAAGGRVARVVDLPRAAGMDLLMDLARHAETARRRALADQPRPARPGA